MSARYKTSGDDLVPIADRMMYLRALRAAMVVLVVVSAVVAPHTVVGATRPLLVATAGYVAAGIAVEGLWRLFRALGQWLFGAMLLIDGTFTVLVGYVACVSSGPQRVLVLVHVMAVAMLASFRTGLKLALWDSVLISVVLYAGERGWLPGTPPIRFGDASYREALLSVAVIWLATLAAATFASVNERELRRRRYDVEALARLAWQLETVSDLDDVARVLAAAIADDFLVPRVLLLAPSGEGFHLVARHPDAGDTPRGLPAPAPDALLAQASSPAGGTLLAASLHSDADGPLATLMPDARNVTVIPLHSNGDLIAILVAEHGKRRGSRVERRTVEMMERFASQGALALANASLLEQIRRQATTDGLTGLDNRRTFDEALDREITQATQSGTTVGLLLIDIDHFKQINDTHGHPTGDATLRQLARNLVSCVRQNDVAARYGGEEFAVVMPGADAEAAVELADRLRRHADTNAPVRFTISVGVAVVPHHASDSAGLLTAADAALYTAKRTGRDRSVLASGGEHALVRPSRP